MEFKMKNAFYIVAMISMLMIATGILFGALKNKTRYEMVMHDNSGYMFFDKQTGQCFQSIYIPRLTSEKP